jgi:integrase
MSGAELVKAGEAGTVDLSGVDPALIETARRRRKNIKAERTKETYRSQWWAFAGWCETRGLSCLPAAPVTVELYLNDRASKGIRPSSLDVALAAISQAHVAAGHPSPRSSLEVRTAREAIRREKGTAPAQKAPVLVSDLRAMVGTLPDTLAGLRDRALLLVGFAGGFRRSELVALELGDLSFASDGLSVTLRRSKTDQEGAGRVVGIPYGGTPATCPVRTLRAWLEAAQLAEGAVFRAVRGTRVGGALSGRDVARTVKRAAELAGLDAARFSGHSLRAGLATAAAKAGKSERAIMRQTGHRSATMVRRYIRDAELFADNAAAGIGL